MLKQKRFCMEFVFLVLAFTSLSVFSAEPADESNLLKPVPVNKARVFLGISGKALTDKWLYEWNVKKLKVQWFGSQNRYYAFNILRAEGDELLPFAKIANNRRKAPHGHYYFDLDPQDLELVAFALNTQNFNTIQGLPGKIKVTLEGGKNYILGYGAGGLEGRLIPTNQIVEASLESELFDFCNKLRGQKLNKQARKKSNADFYTAGGDNYSKYMACNIVANAQPYVADKKFDRMAKWASKKQSKLQDFVLNKIEHDKKRNK